MVEKKGGEYDMIDLCCFPGALFNVSHNCGCLGKEIQTALSSI